MVRARSSQPGSVRRSPSENAAVTGKKITSTAITTFDAMPYPNHSTSSGASANTGTACASSSSGISQRSSVRDAIMPSAASPPTAVPISRPSTVSVSVTSVLQASRPRCSQSARATAVGSGSR